MESNNINDMKSGNAFLNNFFIDDYNSRFAVKPLSSKNIWRKKPSSKELNKIISFKQKVLFENSKIILSIQSIK